MAVEVLDYQGFSNLRRDADLDDAVMVHLQSLQNILTLLAKHQPAKQQDCSLIAESAVTISDFKKLLGRSGHARFRHAPATQTSQGQGSSSALHDPSQMLRIASTDSLNSHSSCKEDTTDKSHSNSHISGHARCRDSTVQKFCHQEAFPQLHKSMPCQLQHPFQPCAQLDQAANFVPKTNSSFLSSLSTDGTVSNGKPVISSRRPPLPPKKRKSPEKVEDRTIRCPNSVNCHCAKRRKLRTRRILRVSTMGLKNGDIPADGYSWCIYGEKLSKDTSQPRVYYKCSSVRGCHARKHVERASDDPNTLIVTYGREHLHPQIHKVLMASE